MAIYDNDVTTSYEIGKLYDNDGTTDRQIGKVYDNDGTTDSLIYTAEVIYFDNGTYDASTGGFTKADTVLSAYSNREGGTVGGYVNSNNAVDLTNINTIYFETYADKSKGYVSVSTTPASAHYKEWWWYGDVYANAPESTTYGTVSIDVSGLTGMYYINAGIMLSQYGTIWTRKVWGE